MNLSELNLRVTDAITVAESLPKGSPESRVAFREVSQLEEAIAHATPADDLEGGLARLGAVAAALSANEPLRALQLGERFASENGSETVSSKLQALLAAAQEQIDSLEDPTVQPVRFTLLTAA